MEWVLKRVSDFILSTPEYNGWGWNTITASFLITAVLTFFLQFPALVKQGETLWKNRSAEGIETLAFIVFFTYFLVFLPYAFSVRSGAGIVNAIVLLIPQVVIVAAVIRFKHFRIVDIVAGVLGIGVFILAMASSYTGFLFALVSIATFVGLLLQAVEMMRAKTSANIALSFPLTFAFVTLVWTIYGVAIGDFLLAGASGAFMLAYLWMTAFWFRYRAS